MSSRRYIILLSRLNDAIRNRTRPASVSIHDYYRISAKLRLEWSIWVHNQLLRSETVDFAGLGR